MELTGGEPWWATINARDWPDGLADDMRAAGMEDMDQIIRTDKGSLAMRLLAGLAWTQATKQRMTCTQDHAQMHVYVQQTDRPPDDVLRTVKSRKRGPKG